jgi:hypothetical protein
METIMARNRGQKKPKLRDYSIAVLTPDESLALREVMMNYQQHPVATAILGGVAIEHELDALLRRRFKRKDDAAWESLTSDKGPFGTFAAKIIAGYAFGLYDEAVKDDLDAVRTIRNAFAHSRRLLDFNDPLIIREMLSTKILYKEGKAILRESEVSSDDAKSAYLNICFSLII